MRILYAALLSMTIVSACGGTPDENSLFVNFGDNGAFTGKAGSNWSEDELRQNSGRSVCGANGKLLSMAFERGADGIAKFSGECGKKS